MVYYSPKHLAVKKIFGRNFPQLPIANVFGQNTESDRKEGTSDGFFQSGKVAG